MPTPEERLATLEQFRTETMRAYTDMAYEVTILKGLGEDSIKRLAALDRSMNAQFEALQSDVQYIRASIDERFQALDNRIDGIVGQLAVIAAKLDEGKK